MVPPQDDTLAQPEVPKAPGHDTQILRAELRTEQAEARTEDALQRAEQAEVKTEAAELRTEQGEQAIRVSEFNYRRLFEAAREGILILETDTGRISDVNPFLVEMIGFTYDELVGGPIWQFAPFKDIVSNKVKFDYLQQQGYVLFENLPLETRDGRKLAVEFVSNVYQAGERNVIQCNVRDVTERKRVEKELRRLAAIVEFSDEAIIGKDLNGIVTDWNGGEKLFGYPASEMIGNSIRQLIPPERQEEEAQILGKVKRGETVNHFETQRLTKSGQVIHISVTVSPIKTVEGEVIGVSKVAHDITERNRAQEELWALKSEMEKRVVERTAQLEAFSYSVSHDLRAPLRHVLGFTEMLQKETGPELSAKQLGHLRAISESAKRMGNLIADLLAFSRIGKSELRKSEIKLDQLMQETLEDFQEEVKGRNIAWEIPPLPVVRADRALLRLVLINLLSNAVKFTSGRAEAKIEIGCVPGENHETVIFIRDNGAGFDPRYLDKMFGVFQRFHSQDEFAGTGIGLANVQQIILRHGGRVWAEGAVDVGATFFFSLPK